MKTRPLLVLVLIDRDLFFLFGFGTSFTGDFILRVCFALV